jgi:small subunit ribosomal protein S20
MPITKSAKKSIRKDKKRTEINIQRKNKVKDLIKKVNNLITQGKREEAKKLLPQIYKTLDKNAKTGIVKKNNVSRRKSRISKAINKIKK